MRRLLAWLAGAAGGAAAYRLLRGRRGGHGAPLPAPPSAPEPDVDPRADALRARLAETREDEPAAGPEAAAAPSEESPEERRRRVHERGREALEDMRGDA